MKKLNLILPLTLLIILALFLSIGCGSGGDTTTMSPSLTNNEGAYLKIKITWPKREIEDENIIISSSNDVNSITTSMYPYTTKVVITARPYYDPNDPNAPPDDPNNYLPNGRKEINWSPGTTQQEIKLGPLPTLKVKVRAESYIESYLIAVGETKPIQLEFGVTPFELDLGLPNIYIKAPPIFLESTLVQEPNDLPLKKSETCIKTKIFLESPDLLPKPTPTVFNPRTNNSIQSQEIVGIEKIKVRYTITSGFGALTADGENYSQSVTLNTDYDGICKANLRSDSHYPIGILYEFFMDRNNPDTVTYSGNNTVTVYGKYRMDSTANPPQIKLNESSNVSVGLYVNYSNFTDYYIPPAPAQNKKVFFEVLSPVGGGSFNPTTAITGDDGFCSSIFTILTEGVTVKVRYVFPIYPEGYPENNSPYYFADTEWIAVPSSGKETNIEGQSSGNTAYTCKEIKRGFIRFDENNNQVKEEFSVSNIPLKVENNPYKVNFIDLKSDWYKLK